MGSGGEGEILLDFGYILKCLFLILVVSSEWLGGGLEQLDAPSPPVSLPLLSMPSPALEQVTHREKSEDWVTNCVETT